MQTSPATRVALVTGGGGAIGSATAARLARDGFAVAVNDVDPQRASETARRIADRFGVATIGVAADIRDAQAVADMVATITEDLGPIDTLINNAGVLRNAPVGLLDEKDWDTVIDTHLKGAFLCSRAVVEPMSQARFGRIVNISSGAVRGSSRGHANYSSAKAGLVGFTKTLAVELGPAGITVNAVAPGAIRSDMTAATAAQIGQTLAEYQANMSAAIPRRRIGEPEDVAEVIAFFASAVNDFVTGQLIFVAGGP